MSKMLQQCQSMKRRWHESGRAGKEREKKVERAGEAWEIVQVPGACTEREGETVPTP